MKKKLQLIHRNVILDKSEDVITWEKVISLQTRTPFRSQGNCQIIKGILVLDHCPKPEDVEESEEKYFKAIYPQLPLWKETKYVVELPDDLNEPVIYDSKTGEDVLNEEREEVLSKIGFKEPNIDNARKIFVTKKTIVRNITGMPAWGNELDQVYIGGATRSGRKRSKWANPFSVTEYGQKGAVEKYREWIKTQPELMSSLHELKGKSLGCWCKPKPCHGDVLAELVNELKE